MRNSYHFLVLILASNYAISQGYTQNYDYYDKLYGHFSENDVRALVPLNQSIKAAKFQKNYQHLTYVYEDAVYFMGDSDVKLHYADSSLVAAKLSKDQSLVAKAHLGKGIVYYYNFRDYRKALDEYRRAHRAVQKSKDSYLNYKIQFHIGLVKKYLGLYGEADSHFAQCVDYFKRSLENVKNNKLHLNERHNMTAGYLNSLYQRSLVKRQLKEYSAARDLISEGLEALNGLEDYSEERGKFMLGHGMDLLFTEDFKSSYSILSDALFLLKYEEDFTALALTHYYLGKTSLDLNEKANAKRHFLAVDSLFSKYGFFEPELRLNYRHLIQGMESKTDHEQKVYYLNQLVKLDSVENREEAYMAVAVLREFDPVTGTIAVSFTDRLIQLLIILFIGGGLFLLIYFKPKRSYIKRKAKILFLRAMRKVKGPPEPFTENQIKTAIHALNQFKKDQGFVQKGIKVEDVAQLVELPPRLISYVLNRIKKENFNSYINRLRVEYAAKQMKESPEIMKFSVQGIAEQAGFASRQVFSKMFQELFGVTPREYIERIKEDRDG